MAENVNIIIKAFDKTEAAFAGIRKQFAKVGASADKLKKRFPTITAAIGFMGSALSTTVKAMAKAMASLAKIGLVAVAGFGYLVKSSLTLSDSLIKTADKIGTTTDALSGLRYAAELTGVQANTLDMAMQRFTRRTAEAAKGTGEAKGAIKELGIDAQKLNRMPLDERMLALADAFGGVESESDRLRLAFKLFDSEGAALVNTLALGRDGLKEMLGEAKALGLGLSKDAAKGIAAANDELTKMRLLFRGVIRQIGAALAPALTFLTKKFTLMLKDVIKLRGGIQNFAKSLAVDVIGGAKIAIQGVEDFINTIINGINAANRAKNAFSNMFSIGKKDAKGYREELDRIKAQIKSTKSATNIPISKQLEVVDQLEAAHKATLNLYHAAQDSEKELKNVDFASSLTAGLDGAILSLTSFEAVADEILPKTTKSVGAVKQAWMDWSNEMPSIQENIKSLTNQGLNGLTDALTAGVTGAANFADAMKAMAKSVIDSLIKMLIQKYIVDAAFGAISSFIGGQASTNRAGGYGASLGSADPFNTSNFAPRAIGGSVQNGSPYMVGERGPEMFVPNSQGSIVPNNRMGGGGGVVVNQTINVTTGVQQTVRAEIATLMPQIANAAKGAVADAKMRGGNYSKMLGA